MWLVNRTAKIFMWDAQTFSTGEGNLLESLFATVGLGGLKSFFGEALQTEFSRTLAIFAAAAWVHSRQVRKEIRAQFESLVGVLKQDLEGNKFLLGQLTGRVTKIEEKLGLESKTTTTKENSNG